jgi:acyl carrier protein
MEIEKDILQCLANVGIMIENYENMDDIFIIDHIDDSIQFISFIIEIETKFNIEIPDEYLGAGEFETLKDVSNMVKMLVNPDI